MSGAQKAIGWVLFAVVIVLLILGSMPDRGHPEGYQGSYLGRSAPAQQADTKALGARIATQRY
jgi:hypothetical protein